MDQIGLYSQITEFTNDNAGTAEWCKAERDGEIFFIKRFQSPVYPSKEIELPEKKRIDRINRFHSAMNEKKAVYQCLQKCDSRGSLVIPFEVMNYQYHICAIANYVEGNLKAEDVCRLSEWQRLVLMRTLTFAVMKIHEAGLVHSDLKPENVIIIQDTEGNCKIKLIDFDGSFFASSPPEEAENVTGDPAYLAPEVLRFCAEENIHLDYHMDVFALGLILHYFWSGKLPEKPANQTMGEYLLRGGILVLDGSLPLALQKSLQGMLAVDPNERINIEKVYSVLGAQISLRHREITKLTEKTEYIHKPKRYEIEVDEYAETDEEPKYKASAKSPRSKTILKKKRKHKKGKILSVLRIAACFLIFFLMLVGEPGIIIKTEEYFSNLKSVQTTLASAAPDPAPLKAASQTASPETARSFSVIDISTKKGKTTIQWEDSLDAGPYIVSYKYAGEGSVKQARFYAGKDEKSSTTHFKFFNTSCLIPGERYIIEVTDSLGTVITKNYFVPWEGIFFEGQLSVASVEVSTKKVYESPSGNGELAAFQANTMSMNMKNGYLFGLYYEVEIPELKSSKSYFTQIIMKGPNGFAQTIVAADVSYQLGNHYWSCLGSYFFDRIKHYNGVIPSGEYTVELFFDGMWVDMLTFSIT